MSEDDAATPAVAVPRDAFDGAPRAFNDGDPVVYLPAESFGVIQGVSMTNGRVEYSAVVGMAEPIPGATGWGPGKWLIRAPAEQFAAIRKGAAP